MLRLAREGGNGLLMAASVVLGFAGLFWLLGAMFSMVKGDVSGFPLGLGGWCVASSSSRVASA